MSRKLLGLSVTGTLLAGAVAADAPRVAVDIAPVHSLVARVMDGVGIPDLIIAPGGSPHEYSLRPSEAGALQDADLVFWVGADLTPWLHDAIENLAGDADTTELLELEGTTTYAFREGALFEAHDHEETDHDDHGHEAEHEHEEEHAHDDDHSHDDDHGHEHGSYDPHAWLSPENAAFWLTEIADKLASADPENADTYRSNAEAGREELAVLSSEISAALDPVRDRNFIVFHDAYQYFERSFEMPASGAISLSDASDPSPARISEIQDRVADLGVTCVLSEPQFDPGLVASVMEGSDARTAVLDPLGSNLDPGAALYPQMMKNLATTLAECL
ncbi:zinc ABC transporter substrate-binding protein [Marivita geojedonensis]|uniref:High-affinity zinc uptake system protein ZnuA n=1 Tax=Marivita geojedonensis TaxID=1123756 RepID=A0A1X4NI88_9RHOB|nr:zinc ABC transporter substrate-binding protein [Marivita geojedonensis]OSQ47593.1 zinc transporter [Marivita geojedonensis]PRY74584.1 zinc transport system substrate-binding protein [Marivita geojedonensis]